MKREHNHSGMYGGVDASIRKEDRRKRLIEAGLEAFGSQGYVRTNIKTICGLAGLTERYFYESFKSKEELLIAVYREITDEMWQDSVAILENRSLSPLEAAQQALRDFYHYFRRDPRKAQIHFFEILGVSRTVDVEYRAGTKLLAEMVKLFLARVFPALTKEVLDKSTVPTGLAGAMVMICGEWILDGFTTPDENIVKESLDFFLAQGNHLEASMQNRRRQRSAGPISTGEKPRTPRRTVS